MRVTVPWWSWVCLVLTPGLVIYASRTNEAPVSFWLVVVVTGYVFGTIIRHQLHRFRNR